MCVIVFDVIGVHNHDFLTINATNLCLMDQLFDDQFRIYTDINQKQNLVGVFRIKKMRYQTSPTSMAFTIFKREPFCDFHFQRLTECNKQCLY